MGKIADAISDFTTYSLVINMFDKWLIHWCLNLNVLIEKGADECNCLVHQERWKMWYWHYLDNEQVSVYHFINFCCKVKVKLCGVFKAETSNISVLKVFVYIFRI